MSSLNNPNSDLFSPFGANRLKVSIDFTLAAWNTATSHEVFTVTGLVRACCIYRITEDLTGGAGATICFGKEGATNSYAAAQLVTALDTGRVVVPSGTIATSIPTWTKLFVITVLADEVLEGLDLGYELAINPATDGTIEAYCYWTPISDGASVVAGAGGAL